MILFHLSSFGGKPDPSLVVLFDVILEYDMAIFLIILIPNAIYLLDTYTGPHYFKFFGILLYYTIMSHAFYFRNQVDYLILCA